MTINCEYKLLVLFMQLKITEEEILSLRQLYSTVKNGKTKDKIKTILMLNDGYKTKEIIKALLIDSDTITNWKKLFISRKDIIYRYLNSYKFYNGKLN